MNRSKSRRTFLEGSVSQTRECKQSVSHFLPQIKLFRGKKGNRKEKRRTGVGSDPNLLAFCFVLRHVAVCAEVSITSKLSFYLKVEITCSYSGKILDEMRITIVFLRINDHESVEICFKDLNIALIKMAIKT